VSPRTPTTPRGTNTYPWSGALNTRKQPKTRKSAVRYVVFQHTAKGEFKCYGLWLISRDGLTPAISPFLRMVE
jgi:hypothetical protein